MKTEKRCTATACSLRGVKVEVEADHCVLCGGELQPTNDAINRIFGDIFGGANPFGPTS